MSNRVSIDRMAEEISSLLQEYADLAAKLRALGANI